MGEAPLEGPPSREVAFEPVLSKARQEIEGAEQFEYTPSEEEDIEAARDEAEKQKFIFQQPATAPPPPLRKSLNKGKQPQFQDYSQRSGDGYQTPTQEKCQKQTQKENPLQDSNITSKRMRRTEGSNKAGRTNRPSDDDPDDEPSSEGSDAGRDANRSGSDDEPDK